MGDSNVSILKLWWTMNQFIYDFLFFYYSNNLKLNDLGWFLLIVTRYIKFTQVKTILETSK